MTDMSKELKALKLAHAVEKQIMQDNFTQCKTAAEHWKAKCDELEKELESWRNSRDGIMAENEALALKAINLACCGNCTQHETRQCPKYDEYRRTGLWTLAWHYCDHYDSDGLNRGEREK